MYGALLGDLAGSRFEFAPVKATDFELVHPDCRLTDDSILTLATAAAVMDGEPFAQTYRSFYRRYPDAGYGQRFSVWGSSDAAPPYHSFGNGSAMRVSPLAWVAKTEVQVLELAQQSALVTHDHPEGVRGAQAVALAIFLARMGASKAQLRKRIESGFGYDLRRTLDQIRPCYGFDVSCQGSVPEALLCFLESDDLVSAIRLAVSLGGDADTQAAIAGSVAEAFYGPLTGELRDWVTRKLDPFLRGVCQRFCSIYLCPYNPDPGV